MPDSRNDAQSAPDSAAGRRAFTLIELLVVIAMIGVLAGLLLPALGRAKLKSHQAECLGNLRQIGLAISMYVDDHQQRFPDRRDLKTTLPGGWRPWGSWPASDPRAGWAAIVFTNYLGNPQLWSCAGSRRAPFADLVQLAQSTGTGPGASQTHYWMWRFDRPDDPVPLDNFWGKSEGQLLADLLAANNPTVGRPTGVQDVELAVDGYFPATIPTVDGPLKGRSVHPGGRNRLFIDGHAEFLRDSRTPR
jgi:prepilin-type N-terminal cleavage/methylation domain-containing protein/prepilin-type processing-associated H-X9-DG protein